MEETSEKQHRAKHIFFVDLIFRGWFWWFLGHDLFFFFFFREIALHLYYFGWILLGYTVAIKYVNRRPKNNMRGREEDLQESV